MRSEALIAWHCGITVLAAFSCLGVTEQVSHAQGTQRTITYESTDVEFLNPERGFYKFSILTDNWWNQYDDVRENGDSLVYGLVVAEDFRNAPLSGEFLNKMTVGFAAARRNGIKVKFRLAYNYDSEGQDAPLPVVLNHIQQLKPIWESNKDVMFHMDAGFIGKWGEWHGSSNGLETTENRIAILEAILDALPVDRTVGVRYPHVKREIFNGSQQSDMLKITAANAFDGSNVSRVGHLNDCLWANHHDAGTYVTENWSRERELEYIGGESRYAAHGGESCKKSTFSAGQNAISEMEILHTDYLHNSYHEDVIQSWRDSGDYDEIKRRLGYRYELEQVKLPAEVRPAGLLPLEFEIDNVGFGELFNRRNVEVTLENKTTGERISAVLSVDPRFWAGGETANVSTHLLLPKDLKEGVYTIGLWMPDVEATLRNDSRYAIRFANNAIWDETTGINVLTDDLVVSEDAAGPAYVSEGFFEVTNLDDLELAGDFNIDGAVNAADYIAWRDGFGAAFSGADFLLWQRNFGATVSPSTAVIPEPSTGLLILIASYLSYWSPQY